MNKKTVYLYDEKTGEYQGVYDAQESPLESGIFIEPVHSTDISPPIAKLNEVAVFSINVKKWDIFPDFRKQTWFDQTTGAETEISDFGTPPANLGDTLPISFQLDKAKTDQKNQLRIAYDVAIYQPIDYLGATFQADASSQDTMDKVLAALGGQSPDGFYWVDANNNRVPITYPQLQGLSSAIFVRGWIAFQNLQDKKVKIEGSATIKAVQKIVF